MKRKIFALVLALTLFGALAFSVQAADLPRFVDAAGLVSPAQGETILDKLDSYSEQLQFDFIICTVDSIGAAEPRDYAEYVFDNYDYGYGPNRDGALLLVSMEFRDCYLLSNGSGATYINDDAIDYILDQIVPTISNGNYEKAFMDFTSLASNLVVQGMEGNVYRSPFPFVKTILIGFGISLLIGLIVVGGYKSELKSVRKQASAANYVTDGSLNVTDAKEIFLYHQVTRTPRPKNNTTTRSGGGARTGGGRKF